MASSSQAERLLDVVCAFGIFRDKGIFGDEEVVFRPEKWLDGEGEKGRIKVREMERCLESAFSWRKYKCLVQNLALMELNKIFVEVSEKREGKRGAENGMRS